jgi:hypothetical protein
LLMFIYCTKLELMLHWSQLEHIKMSIFHWSKFQSARSRSFFVIKRIQRGH